VNTYVCYTVDEWNLAEASLRETLRETLAFDTETMGVQWYERSRQRLTVSSTRREVLEKEMAQLTKAKEAISPRTNILATAQFATEETAAIVVLKDPFVANRVMAFINQVLDYDPDTTWLIQNSKFDLTQIHHHWGIEFESYHRIWDPALAETLIIADRNDDRSNLDALAKRYCEHLTKGDAKSAVSDWWTEPLTHDQVEYGLLDVIILHEIRAAQAKILTARGQDRVGQLEFGLPPALVGMESIGVRFDTERLQEFIRIGDMRLKDSLAEFHDVFPDVNPSSPKQVLSAIEAQYGVVPMKSKWNPDTKRVEQVPSVDKHTMLKYGLRHEGPIKALFAVKEIGKNITDATTWVNSPYGRFYTDFIQVKRGGTDESGGTRTGRLSSRPNLQNQSNFMDQFLIADDGWEILTADYSAIELRLIASYAGEDVLKQIFLEGRDPHTEMAEWAFQIPKGRVGKKSRERRIAKEVNFGFIYGMFGRTFCHRVLIATDGEIQLAVEEGHEFRRKFFERYKAIERWHRSQFSQACALGYVTTRSGRRREYNWSNRPSDVRPTGRLYHPLYGVWFTSAYSTDWKWRNITYNTPIQGTGGDGLKHALTLLYDRAPDWLRPFATRHDSISCLVRTERREDGAHILAKAMIDGMTPFMPDVPVEVEVTCGHSWANSPVTKYRLDGSVREIGLDLLQTQQPDISVEKLIRQVTVDHGLWLQTKFQEEVKLEDSKTYVAA